MQCSNSEVGVGVERILRGLPLGKYDGPSMRACFPPAQAVDPQRIYTPEEVQASLKWAKVGFPMTMTFNGILLGKVNDL